MAISKQLCQKVQGPCKRLHICRLATSNKAVLSMWEHGLIVQRTAWYWREQSPGSTQETAMLSSTDLDRTHKPDQLAALCACAADCGHQGALCAGG